MRRGPLQIGLVGRLRWTAETRIASDTPFSHIRFDLARYDLAGAPPFTGVWEGTWNDPSGGGPVNVAVDRAGRVTGWLRHTPSSIIGDIRGQVTAAGEFTASVRYPFDLIVTLRGTVQRFGSRAEGSADETRDGQPAGRLTFELRPLGL